MIEPTDEDLMAAIEAAGLDYDPADIPRLLSSQLRDSLYAHAATLAKVRELKSFVSEREGRCDSTFKQTGNHGVGCARESYRAVSDKIGSFER